MNEPNIKPKKFKTKAEKRIWLAKIIEQAAKDVLSGKYGTDGCDGNADGYCVSDVISDAASGFE